MQLSNPAATGDRLTYYLAAPFCRRPLLPDFAVAMLQRSCLPRGGIAWQLAHAPRVVRTCKRRRMSVEVVDAVR